MACSEIVELKMPDGDGGFGTFPVGNELKVVQCKEFFALFSHMILAVRPSGDWNSEYEQGLLKMMMDKHDVTCKEAHEAFLLAYGDQYTPASGIEWRHLWKQIEVMRKGRDRREYTYQEMLNICDKESITTEYFKRVGDDRWVRK